MIDNQSVKGQTNGKNFFTRGRIRNQVPSCCVLLHDLELGMTQFCCQRGSDCERRTRKRVTMRNMGPSIPSSWMGHKDQGKRHFQNERYEDALASYRAGISPEYNCPRDERQIMLSNIVACRLKIGGSAMAAAAVEEAKQVSVVVVTAVDLYCIVLYGGGCLYSLQHNICAAYTSTDFPSVSHGILGFIFVASASQSILVGPRDTYVWHRPTLHSEDIPTMLATPSNEHWHWIPVTARHGLC